MAHAYPGPQRHTATPAGVRLALAGWGALGGVFVPKLAVTQTAATQRPVHGNHGAGASPFPTGPDRLPTASLTPADSAGADLDPLLH